jgi:hypothetical protein
MAFAKLRFLGIVRAKLRTEMFAVGRPPNFDMAVAEKEWLVAERAAREIAALEMLAARDHPSLQPKQEQLAYLLPRKFSCR